MKAEDKTVIMKQRTNFKKALAGATLLCLASVGGAMAGNTAWAAGGFLGFAAIAFSTKLRAPKLAPVRVRSYENRA